MGSIITLSAGTLDIDYGKNEGFISHAHLFQAGDEATGPYNYVGKDEAPILEMKPCLERPLGRMKARLELLGYTLAACREQVEAWLSPCDDDEPEPDFEAFVLALGTLPWCERSGYVDFDEALRLAYCQAAGFGDEALSRAGMVAFEKFLDPCVVLRLLAERVEYQHLPIRWNYADVLENGWVTEEQVSPAPPPFRWIIATEGSSDTAILRKSLPLLFPDVADFFEFIDMKDGYPFAGVGNIINFCKGLSRIRYAGSMLFVLDNDTAGRDALVRMQAINRSPSVRVTCLPHLDDVRSFRTLGPGGENNEDINGRACAIECFLDFSAAPDGTPSVRWTAFNEGMQAYQGELVRKERYQDDFHERFGSDPLYDDSKLRCLWEHLIRECIV